MGKSLNVPMDVVHDVMLILDYHSTPSEPSGTMMRRAGAIHSKLRDLMDAGSGGEWLDISTATKNETVIIGSHPLWVYPLTIYWCTIDGRWKRSQDETPVEPVPTHWMPLPSAPAEGGGE